MGEHIRNKKANEVTTPLTGHLLPKKQSLHTISYDNSKKFAGHAGSRTLGREIFCTSLPRVSAQIDCEQYWGGASVRPARESGGQIIGDQVQHAVAPLNHRARKVLSFRLRHDKKYLADRYLTATVPLAHRS